MLNKLKGALLIFSLFLITINSFLSISVVLSCSSAPGFLVLVSINCSYKISSFSSPHFLFNLHFLQYCIFKINISNINVNSNYIYRCLLISNVFNIVVRFFLWSYIIVVIAYFTLYVNKEIYLVENVIEELQLFISLPRC